MDQMIQLVVVVVIVGIAAVYAGWRILGQLTRSEDEAAGCSGCPANPATRAKAPREAAPSEGQIVKLRRRPHP